MEVVSKPDNNLPVPFYYSRNTLFGWLLLLLAAISMGSLLAKMLELVNKPISFRYFGGPIIYMMVIAEMIGRRKPAVTVLTTGIIVSKLIGKHTELSWEDLGKAEFRLKRTYVFFKALKIEAQDKPAATMLLNLENKQEFANMAEKHAGDETGLIPFLKSIYYV